MRFFLQLFCVAWVVRISGMHVAVAQVLAVPASKAPRVVVNFDADWRFNKGDSAGGAAGAQRTDFADESWRMLDVPHDWSIEGPFDAANPSGRGGGFAPAGVAWYRKSFTLPTEYTGKHIFIDFDGVMANSEVFINGVSVGKRPSGYVSFQYELTKNLHFDRTLNVLAVRVDDAAQPASRWYTGAGIYRHVRLEVENPVHLSHWATFVTTPAVAADHATVMVRTRVESDVAQEVAIETTLVSPDGDVLFPVRSQSQKVEAGKPAEFTQNIPVEKPLLWDVIQPNLYRAVVRVVAGGGGGGEEYLDAESVTFGIRTAEFRSTTGFWLNGRNIKIKGVCLHHEAGGLGAAVPEDEWIYRLSALKQLGTNAIRTAHNPESPEFLDACDRVGLVVMDEMFDCWMAGKNTYDYHLYFKDWNLIDTRDTVLRDRNHPSIILYSAGNEIHDTPRPEAAIPTLQSLVNTFHEADPTRPVTQALFRPNQDGGGGAYKNGLADLLDVVGTNYRDAELLAAWKDKPTRKIINTESGLSLAAWALARDNPAHAGQFLWTGTDYLGESLGWPAIGHNSGLLDLTDRVKAEGLQRASWWSEKPVVAMVRGGGGGGQIASGNANPDEPQSRFSAVSDWTPANPGPHVETVDVYSNCDQVELVLNGRSLGTKARGMVDSPRSWAVNYEKGTIRAIGKNRSNEVVSTEMTTAGKPAKIVLTSNTTVLHADFDSLAHLTACIVDDRGIPVPGADNLVTFQVTGPGQIPALETGNLASHESFQGDHRYAYMGDVVALVRAAAAEGTITIRAAAPGLEEGSIKVETAGTERRVP